MVAVLLGLISVAVGDGVEVGGMGVEVAVLVSVAVGTTTVLVGVSVATAVWVGMAVMVGKNCPIEAGKEISEGAKGLLNQTTAAIMPIMKELSNKRVPNFCDRLRVE